MALVIKENIVCGTILGVWKKEEDLAVLESVYPLSEKEKQQLEQYSNEGRKIDFLTSRILLTELMEGRFSIGHKGTGKPFIEESDFRISISHSKNFVSMIISKNKEVGVDVEHISERPRKVRKKFMTANELKWCADDEGMTILWSAKEAIFKIFEKDLDFQSISVDRYDFEEERGTFVSRVDINGREHDFFLSYWKIEDDVLVYTTSDCVER
jgi:phosphopantetheinyl transferase